MKILKRGATLASMAIVAMAILASAASAAISPNPYVLGTADSGTFIANTALGRSTCAINGLRGSIGSTANGASGSVTAANVVTPCGLIQRATILPPLTVSIAGAAGAATGTVTIGVAILIVNSFGGQCLYAGTLTGTVARPASSFTASNTRLALVRNLNGGICSNPADVALTVNTRAVVTWP